MSNINRNSYFALKVPLGDYAYSNPVSGFSLAGTSPFSVSMNFYADHIDHQGAIFKQDGTIEIGIDKGLLYCISESFGSFTADVPVPEKMWNIFDVVYNKTELLFYLNGFLCFQQNTAVPSVPVSTSDYILGKGLGGYLRFVKIFNFALSQQDIVQNQYKNTIAKEKTELFFDFSTLSPRDLGKNSLTIFYKNRCNPKNVVKTISFDQSGFAYPAESSRVNPGGFKSGEFTIVSKVYIRPSRNQNTVIFTNGGMDAENGVTLGLANHWDSERSNLFLKMGNSSFVSAVSIPSYQWVDIAAGCSAAGGNKTIRLYADGTLALEQAFTETFHPPAQGSVVIGNTLHGGMPQEGCAFNGYIDYVSIFDKALAAADLKNMVDTPPFVYDDNLIALYSFNSDDTRESLSKSSVALNSGASIGIQENTVTAEAVPQLNYSCTDIPKQYSDFDTWQAGVLAFAFTEFIAEETGMAVTSGFADITTKAALLTRVSNLFVKEVLPLKEAQTVINSYQLIPRDKLLNLLKQLRSKGLLDNLVKTFYSKSLSFIPGSIGTASLSALSTSAAPYLAALLPLLLVPVIVKVAEKTKKDPPPIPGPPDDPTIKYRQIRVEKITFNHNRNDSAVSGTNIRKNAQEEIPVPEWVNTVNNNASKGSQAAYIKSKAGNVYIKVKLYYETNYTDTFHAEITGKCFGDGVLGDIPAVSINVTTAGYYDIDVPLSGKHFSEKGAGSYQDQINWSWNGVIPFIGTSYHDIHMIEDVPLAPWSIKAQDTAKYPTVDALRFCSDAFKRNPSDSTNIGEIKNLQSVAADITRHLFQCGKLTYNVQGGYEPVYSQFNDAGTLIFQGSRFYREFIFSEGNLRVNSLDCALIIADSCRLEGYKLDIVEVKSALEDIWNEEVHQFIPVPLEFLPVKLIGGHDFEALQDVDAHYIAAEITGEANIQTLAYDGCLTGRSAAGEEITTVNLPFSDSPRQVAGAQNNQYYRETFFQEGTSCVVKDIIEAWESP